MSNPNREESISNNKAVRQTNWLTYPGKRARLRKKKIDSSDILYGKSITQTHQSHFSSFDQQTDPDLIHATKKIYEIRYEIPHCPYQLQGELILHDCN